MERIFLKYGTVTGVVISEKNGGSALVEFLEKRKNLQRPSHIEKTRNGSSNKGKGGISKEERGRWVGISENVVHDMTFKILRDKKANNSINSIRTFKDHNYE